MCPSTCSACPGATRTSGSRFAPGDTLAGALGRTRAALSAAGLPDAPSDARHLVALATGADAARMLSAPDARLGVAAAARLDAVLRRRLAREPIGRIAGEREFWGLRFRLSAATLEPRPDTETIVVAALGAIADRDRPIRILDLGTGTGCILLALLGECPNAFGVGIDRSWAACETARGNAALNRLAGRAGFAVGDWHAAIAGRFDAIVSNPPYIASRIVVDLAPEVRLFDPAAALDGGSDGLSAYRAILPRLPDLLAPGAVATVEIGFDQEEAVRRLAEESGGLRVERCVRDLGGNPRALVLGTR